MKSLSAPVFSAVSVSKPGPSPALTEMFPVAVAYLPIAFAFGMAAREVGLDFQATALMSLLVNAGSSQMLALTLLAAGQEMFAIVLTTFLVNARHLLLSAVVAPSLKEWKPLQRLLFGMQMTDETFALMLTHLPRGAPPFRYGVGINLIGHGTWMAGTLLGYWVSEHVFDFKIFGLDFALAALILGVLALQLDNFHKWVAAAVSAAVGIAAVRGHWSAGTLILAALLGPFVAVVSEKVWNGRRFS